MRKLNYMGKICVVLCAIFCVGSLSGCSTAMQSLTDGADAVLNGLADGTDIVLNTKDEILELYVNSIYFGDGYYCIYDASQGYFGKAPIDMTNYECTLLAGIPNAPSVYSLTANPELAEQRQEYVVQRMVQYGYISEGEAQSILQDQS